MNVPTAPGQVTESCTVADKPTVDEIMRYVDQGFSSIKSVSTHRTPVDWDAFSKWTRDSITEILQTRPKGLDTLVQVVTNKDLDIEAESKRTNMQSLRRAMSELLTDGWPQSAAKRTKNSLVYSFWYTEARE